MKNRSSVRSKGRQQLIQQEHSSEEIKLTSWIVAFFLASITFLFYLPVLHHQFVNWDDALAILENLHLRNLNLSFLHWMLTTFHTGNWIPLTWLSLALDYAIGQLNPTIYHLHNLLLHTFNTVLVFFLSFKLLKLAAINGIKIKGNLHSSFKRGWIDRLSPEMGAAALTALLFGLHPIHVESVAWAAERKDLLFSFFFLASVLLYLDYATSREGKLGKWMACLGLFALSLLSKPMAITLPVILLLLDIWPLQRVHDHLSQVLLEKIPFFILSLIIAVMTIIAQAAAGAISSTTEVPIDYRIMNAFHSLVFYAWKMAVPIHLSPLYPLYFQGKHALSATNVIAFCVVLSAAITCYYYRKTRPYFAMALLFYVVTLFPVLGILQVGSQAAADRYTYLPSLSLFLLFATGITLLFFHRRFLFTCLSMGLVTTLGWATLQQIAIWSNSISLWERGVSIYPDMSMIIHTNMANAYKQFGRLDEALSEYDRALSLGHHHAYIHDGKGMVLLDKGVVDQAIEEFHQAIALDHTYASPHRNLWFAYDKKGLHDLALAEIQEAVRINPHFADAFNNLGISHGRKGQFAESIEAFKKALTLDPHNSMYLINLATTYQREGQFDKAIELYKKGIKLNSKESVYFLNLGNTYLLKGMLIEAIEILQAATHLHPLSADIFEKLAIAYEKLGKKELAIQNYEKAMHLKGKK